MRRQIGLSVVVLCLSGAFARADAAAAASPVGRTMATLDATIPEFRFDQVAASDVFSFLHDTSGIDIDAEWDELAKAGITRDTPVTTKLRNIKLSKAIDQLIDSLATPAVKADINTSPMRTVKTDGHLVITTRKDLFSRFATKMVYSVADLRLPKDAGPGAPTVREMRNSIKALIEETIAVATWNPKPGEPGGTVAFAGDQMTVFQTTDTQHQIATMLEKLRQQANEIAAPTPVPAPAK